MALLGSHSLTDSFLDPFAHPRSEHVWASAPWIALQTQHNPNQNPSKLFYGCKQTDSKVSIGRQKTQNSQHNIEEEE